MSSNLTFKSVLETSPFPQGIIEILDNDIYYHYINTKGANLHGRLPQTIINRSATEIGIDSKTLYEWMAHCREVLLTKAAVEFQSSFTSDGQKFLLRTSMYQIGHSEKTGRPLLAFKILNFDNELDAPEKIEPVKLDKHKELQFEILANSINQLSWMADANGWVYWFNDRWYEYTGGTPQEMQGWGWTRVHHPDHLARIEKIWRESLPIGKPIEVTFPIKGKSGEYRWFLTRVEAVRDSSGEIIRWFGTSTDIHDQKTLEANLKKTEERLSMAVENALVGFYDWEIPQNQMIFSDRMMKDWGITSKESCATLEAAFLLIHPDDRNRVKIAVDEAIKNRAPYQIQYRVVHPDGTIKWMDVHGTIHYDQKGTPIRFFGTSVNVTSVKEAEDALRKREQELLAFIEGMPQMAFMADSDGNLTYYNNKHYEYFGVARGETENWAWMNTKIHHDDDFDRTVATWKSALSSGSLYEIEYRLRRHDGEYRWHLARAYPIKDEAGKITRWVGTNTDIHDQKVNRV